MRSEGIRWPVPNEKGLACMLHEIPYQGKGEGFSQAYADRIVATAELAAENPRPSRPRVVLEWVGAS